MGNAGYAVMFDRALRRRRVVQCEKGLADLNIAKHFWVTEYSNPIFALPSTETMWKRPMHAGKNALPINL